MRDEARLFKMMIINKLSTPFDLTLIMVKIKNSGLKSYFWVISRCNSIVYKQGAFLHI
jgi:hypothetical protein